MDKRLEAPMETMAGLIVILGSPNDDQGKLSAMAQGRVALGCQWYQARRAAGWKLLLTGGFGEHFNRTTHPHAYYLQQWLLAQGVPPQEILEFVLSHHTGKTRDWHGRLWNGRASGNSWWSPRIFTWREQSLFFVPSSPDTFWNLPERPICRPVLPPSKNDCWPMRRSGWRCCGRKGDGKPAIRG
ncbi:MAG: ElyC/SanA/YdcF family protein [Caldilineaceae bacterium]